MSNIFLHERNPFDILVRNFLQTANGYAPLAESKLPHPVDIYETETHLVFDIACTGVSQEELEVQTQNNTLRVNYDKGKDDCHCAPECNCKDVSYIHKGIAKRSFNLGWKIDSKFDLSKADAEFKYGLLKIAIPYAKGSEVKTLKIK